ncbi:UNVERIFIED_ORG: DUF2730 domain-containing protein [Roseateles sp. XES5]|nr:DUF2730 family protein [Roseateles sp. XES5]
MDVSPLKDWLGLIALLISVGSSVVLFLKSDAKKAGETLISHGSRIQKLEDDMRHMPDKETVHKLQIDLTEMKGQMATMVKSSEATERATRRVEDFLLKKA